mmetsp:Transcript_39234/g.62679  ORF Transcript_39234/g.62679 Transcript_39234/m.62679 type:complete len:260 (+) Transcript_39234:35-814(+)|eukprot:CAMPEP_0197026872 /NCGR_PEP_ID=MMETSP1384-20130603/6882_1 /TAXON_ID=29189 /ORGANISM="Ammonia sp." /LENGTH=259 /DNA_ID=CAMNT_0042455625 /DNA_START=27 /DNA_END=806 /DNA_ORIENTATION=+
MGQSSSDEGDSTQIYTTEGSPYTLYVPPAKKVNFVERKNPDISGCTTLVIASRGGTVKGKAKGVSAYSYSKGAGSGLIGLNVDYDIHAITTAEKQPSKIYVLNGKNQNDQVTAVNAKKTITAFLNNDQKVQTIYYSGHGDEDGDWCFPDGYVTFEWLYGRLSTYNSNTLCVVTDCCHSGTWVAKLAKKDRSVTKKCFMTAACGSDNVAWDNELARYLYGDLEGNEDLRGKLAKNGCCLFFDNKTVTLKERTILVGLSWT